MLPQQPAAQPEPQPEPQPATEPELYQVPRPDTSRAPQPELYQVPQPETFLAPQPDTYQAPQPDTDQMPQPVSAAADVTGHEAPAWGSPVAGPAELPPPPFSPAPFSPPPSSTPPLSAPPYSAPPFSTQPPRPDRRAFRILVAAALVIAVAIVATAVLGWSSVSDLRQGVSDRQAEQATIAQQEEAAARKLLDDFRRAGLDSLLQRVKDLDKAADVAFGSWRSGSVRFGVLDAAMNDCNAAVIAYNNAAGPFPDTMLTALPRQIDLKNPETDCGRAFTASI
jgi:hypothetical protein